MNAAMLLEQKKTKEKPQQLDEATICTYPSRYGSNTWTSSLLVGLGWVGWVGLGWVGTANMVNMRWGGPHTLAAGNSSGKRQYIEPSPPVIQERLHWNLSKDDSHPHE